MSQSESFFTASTHNASRHATAERSATRTIDWSGYPALFQRVTPAPARPTPAAPREPVPAPAAIDTRDVRGAFLGFCQAALFAPFEQHNYHLSGIYSVSERAFASAEAFGFTRDEIRCLGCGLYLNPTAVEEHLRAVGFTAAEIDAACLARDDAGRLRSELAGSLVVPLNDESGRLVDFLLLTPGEPGRSFSGYRFLYGAAKTKTAAYGLQGALARPLRHDALVIVDDVLECLLLQCRGIERVCALCPVENEFSPWRWEELSRLGVTTATLAFRRDAQHRGTVRDALVSALRARTAPQVLIVDDYPGNTQSAADVLRRFGKEACAKALAACSLAFHDKDFGAAAPVRTELKAPPVETPAPKPPVAPAEPYHRDAFRRHLAELAAALPPADRTIAEQTIAAVDAALHAGDHARAASIVDWSTWGQPWNWHPAEWPHAVRVTNQHLSASVASAAAVLERLVKSTQTIEIPTHLAGYAGREAASSVEWLVDPEPRSRLATLCERLIDACDRRPGQAFVVACCEHSPQQIVLALMTCLAARLSEGAGLTIEEVRTRLSGSEPATGYRDKPWLVDEAADRLRLWSSRLTFVTCPVGTRGRAAIETAVDGVRAKTALGGIYFDGLPGTEWVGASTIVDSAWLRDLSVKTGSPIVAAASTAPVEAPPTWPIGHWPGHWHAAYPAWTLSHTANGETLLGVLRDWIRREQT